jgi:hypothetical protein
VVVLGGGEGHGGVCPIALGVCGFVMACMLVLTCWILATRKQGSDSKVSVAFASGPGATIGATSPRDPASSTGNDRFRLEQPVLSLAASRRDQATNAGPTDLTTEIAAGLAACDAADAKLRNLFRNQDVWGEFEDSDAQASCGLGATKDAAGIRAGTTVVTTDPVHVLSDEAFAAYGLQAVRESSVSGLKAKTKRTTPFNANSEPDDINGQVGIVTAGTEACYSQTRSVRSRHVSSSHSSRRVAATVTASVRRRPGSGRRNLSSGVSWADGLTPQSSVVSLNASDGSISSDFVPMMSLEAELKAGELAAQMVDASVSSVVERLEVSSRTSSLLTSGRNSPANSPVQHDRDGSPRDNLDVVEAVFKAAAI